MNTLSSETNKIKDQFMNQCINISKELDDEQVCDLIRSKYRLTEQMYSEDTKIIIGRNVLSIFKVPCPCDHNDIIQLSIEIIVTTVCGNNYRMCRV